MSQIKAYASNTEFYVVSTGVPGSFVRHVMLSFSSWPLQVDEANGVIHLAYEMGYIQHSCWFVVGLASIPRDHQKREFLVDPALPLAECVKGIFIHGMPEQIFATKEEAERVAEIYMRTM